ncbi:MAG: hypothetical protein AAF656_03770, partial [Planctomycetota bacterium]
NSFTWLTAFRHRFDHHRRRRHQPFVALDHDHVSIGKHRALDREHPVVVEEHERLMPSTPVVIEAVSEGGEPRE